MTKNTNKTKKRRGGMILPSQNNVEALSVITQYLENSLMLKLAQGAFGIVWMSKLREGVTLPTPYVSMEPGAKYGEPVRNLVLKVCVIGDYDAMEINQQRLIDSLLRISPIPEEKFENEINVQTDIFMKTMNYLQPICPAIVFGGTFQTTAFASKIMKLLETESVCEWESF